MTVCNCLGNMADADVEKVRTTHNYVRYEFKEPYLGHIYVPKKDSFKDVEFIQINLKKA